MAAAMDRERVECRECRAVNEVEPTTRPPCNVCGVTLRLGTLLPAREESMARGEDGETEVDGAPLDDDRPEPTAAGGARERCGCDNGGPRPGNPAVCFRCGKLLPALDAASDGEAVGSGSTGAASLLCTLVLEDGHRARIGPGLLVSGDASCRIHPAVVCIDSPTVSRRHAWLREVRGRVEIVDLGSTNGTWIEGERIEAFRVASAAPDARIRLSFGRGVQAALEFGAVNGGV